MIKSNNDNNNNDNNNNNNNIDNNNSSNYTRSRGSVVNNSACHPARLGFESCSGGYGLFTDKELLMSPIRKWMGPG